jgi:hypothetical protein
MTGILEDRDAIGKDAIGKDAIGKDAIGKDAINRVSTITAYKCQTNHQRHTQP